MDEDYNGVPLSIEDFEKMWAVIENPPTFNEALEKAYQDYKKFEQGE